WAHVESLAGLALGVGELTQPVLTVETAEPTVADSAERDRSHADERQRRVDRDAARTDPAGDRGVTLGGEHGGTESESRVVRPTHRLLGAGDCIDHDDRTERFFGDRGIVLR